MNDLPGIEALFRENRRLANKLTQDESKALRRYIKDLLELEQGEMTFQLSAVRTEYNAEIRKCSDTIEALQQEIKDKDELLKYFSKSDENLATVHKKRGERLEQMQSVLVNDMEMKKIKCQNLSQQLTEVKEELREKTFIIQEQNIRLDEFEKLKEYIDGCDKMVFENKSLCSKNLKLKLELDKRDKLFTDLQERLLTIQKETNQLLEEKEECDNEVSELKKDLMSLSQEIADQCEQLSLAKDELEQKSERNTDIAKELESLKSTMRVQDSFHPRNPPPTQTSNCSDLLKQYEYLLFRTEILEETIEKYKGDCKTLDVLRDQSLTDECILNDARSRNGSLAVEQLLQTLALRIRSRKYCCFNSLSRLQDRLQSDVAVVAKGLKIDILDLKQTYEQLQMSDLCSDVKRLIPRIDACLNAKYKLSKNPVNSMPYNRPSSQRRSQSQEQTVFDNPNGRTKPQLTISNKASGVHDTHANRSYHLEKRRSSVPNKPYQLSPTPINLSMTRILTSTPQYANTKSFDFEIQPSGRSSRSHVIAWKSDTHLSIK